MKIGKRVLPISIVILIAVIIGTLIFFRSDNAQRMSVSAPTNEATTRVLVSESEYAEYLRNRNRDFDLPVRVSVPKLSIDAPVIPVGLDEWRSVEVPENIDFVGWYELGVSPHQGYGSAALVGHRDGEGGQAGVFLRIGELEIGEIITVTNRDGREIVYRVSRVELVSKERFPIEAERFFAESGPAQLTLISCGGSYDRSRGGYQANIVVTSTPIRS